MAKARVFIAPHKIVYGAINRRGWRCYDVTTSKRKLVTRCCKTTLELFGKFCVVVDIAGVGGLGG